MRISLRAGLVAAVSAATLLTAAPSLAETLADAIRLAYDTNPTLQSQRASQRAQDENYVQARAGYRPTLSAGGSANYSHTRSNTIQSTRDINFDGVVDSRDTTGGISETNSGSISLSLSQPVYTGGRVSASVSAAEADILRGREDLRRVEISVLQSVIQAYVDVRRDQQILSIRQENVAVLQRQLEESKARFEAGEITRTDVAQSEARLASAQAQLSQAQATLGISRASYAALVGQNPTDLAPEPPLAGLLPATAEQAFSVAESDNAQVRAAEYAEQASRARLAGAKAERNPSVSARGSYGFDGPLDPYERELFNQGISAGLTLSMPLFSGGAISSRIRQADERNNADRIAVDTAKRAAAQSVAQAWNQLQAARANIVSNDQGVRAAAIAAEGTRQEQQVGLRTTLDVLNAEQELRLAQLALVQARRDEYVASAGLLAAVGHLNADDLSAGITEYDPRENFDKVKRSWGWVPWEIPIEAVDSIATPKTVEKAPVGELVPTAPPAP